MPNRILRDWTDSETIDSLSVHEERFFTRLIMKVDDYGRFFANVKLLKANLYPLKSDVRESDISQFLTACEKLGLILLYNIASKEYLEIQNFKQVLRQKKEKFPPPNKCVSSATQVHSECLSSASLNRNEVESEVESEGEEPPGHFYLIPEMSKIFYEKNPTYSKNEELDFTPIKIFADFFSHQNFKVKDCTQLEIFKKQQILDDFRLVAEWYSIKKINKSLADLAKFKLQEIQNEIKNGIYNSNSINGKERTFAGIPASEAARIMSGPSSIPSTWRFDEQGNRIDSQ